MNKTTEAPTQTQTLDDASLETATGGYHGHHPYRGGWGGWGGPSPWAMARAAAWGAAWNRPAVTVVSY